MNLKRILQFVVALLSLTSTYSVLGCPTDAVTVSKLKEMNESYKDVKSPISCQKAKSKIEKLICSSPSLIVLSDLDAKAQVFGLENATHQEVSHTNVRDKDWEKSVLNKCADETCICDAYTAHIQQYLPDFNQ